MELRIPFYGTQISWFTALSGEIRRPDAIAFGVYRRQAELFGGGFDGKFSAPRKKVSECQ